MGEGAQGEGLVLFALGNLYFKLPKVSYPSGYPLSPNDLAQLGGGVAYM